MNVRVLSVRTGDRATIWFWDWFGSLLLALFVGFGAVALREHLPWWLWPGVPAACLLTHRIRITRAEPATGYATTFWFVIPVRRRRFELRALHSARSDDWGGDPDDPHDSLESGSWSLVCHHAPEVAAWLRDAGSEFSTPRAEVKSPR